MFRWLARIVTLVVIAVVLARASGAGTDPRDLVRQLEEARELLERMVRHGP